MFQDKSKKKRKKKHKKHGRKKKKKAASQSDSDLDWKPYLPFSRQLTSRVIFAFDYQKLLPPSSLDFHLNGETNRLECWPSTCEVKMRGVWVPPNGSKWCISFVVLLPCFLYIIGSSYSQRQDWAPPPLFFFFCGDFSVPGTPHPTIIALLELVPVLYKWHLPLLHEAVNASACVVHVDMMSGCLASLILKLAIIVRNRSYTVIR